MRLLDEDVQMAERYQDAHDELVQEIWGLEDLNGDGTVTWEEFSTSKFDDPWDYKIDINKPLKGTVEYTEEMLKGKK